MNLCMRSPIVYYNFVHVMYIKFIGLTDSRNVQCQKYSGGMKRRLSAAMVRKTLSH